MVQRAANSERTIAAMGEVIHAYAATIEKAEKTADGDLLVTGKAAGPDLDLDGQICDPEWLKTAMPEWQRWGNIRAQHSPIAAGVGVELAATGNDWNLKGLIVDEDSKKKVEKRVYKGYSIGIKNARVVKDAKAPKGRIVGGDIVEISLVDRPANPTATMTICKAATLGDLQPVDADGELLDLDKAATARLPLSAEARKAAEATVDGVLSGDLLKALDERDDIDGAWSAIGQVSDVIAAEAMALKAGRPDEPHDITALLKAVDALRCFIDEPAAPVLSKMGAPADPDDEDEDESDDEGYEDDTVDKAANRDSGRWTDTLVSAEITKAVAKATGPLEAELQTLRAEVAKAMAAPIPGGPVLITQPAPALTKSSEADKFRAIANQPTLDPTVAAAYRALAEAKEEAAA